MAIQAGLALTTIRGRSQAPQPERIIYIPEVHSGFGVDPLDEYRTQNYFPELKMSDTTKATIVADIASAQHEDIRRVIAIDLANGKSWDASKEIAQEVLEILVSEDGHVENWARGFLEEHLGVAHVNQAERWDRVA